MYGLYIKFIVVNTIKYVIAYWLLLTIIYFITIKYYIT